MDTPSSRADAELMASAISFSEVVDALAREREVGAVSSRLTAEVETAVQRVEAACRDPAATQAGLQAAYAIAGPAADLLDEVEHTEAVAFSLRGRGDKGERGIEAEVMGDGDVVPAIGTGGGGAGHRFVAVLRWATRRD